MSWTAVLHRLAAQRARAWIRGTPGLLRGVYEPGSVALRDDGRNLAAYRNRGLRVRGVRLSFADVHIMGRRPGLIRLDVVDRLGAMTAVTTRGDRLRLPRDRPTRHVIVLRRDVGRWRIAAVEAH